MRNLSGVRLQIVVCVPFLAVFQLSGISRWVDVNNRARRKMEVVVALVLDHWMLT